MNIDDRLRSAQQRRLEETRRRLADADPHIVSDRGVSAAGRLFAVAASLLVAAGLGAALLVGVWRSDDTIQTDVAVSPDSRGDPAVTTSGPVSDTRPSDGESIDTELPDDAGSDASSAPMPTTTAAVTTSTREVPTTAAGVDAAVDPGVTTTVCRSGRRASLELAELAYVGESRGWGRLDDLVDEQDAPFYFQGWEPGFPDPVAVEVVLASPVLAADIRLAQDPYTEVAGVVTIDGVGEPISITLDGIDGWRVHRFDAPTLVERFVITRRRAASNVMEVMVCLADAP